MFFLIIFSGVPTEFYQMLYQFLSVGFLLIFFLLSFKVSFLGSSIDQ